jgi:lipid II:glycine glycyltransferase (peptidoglycan interpeptide bridge formation enzyme)
VVKERLAGMDRSERARGEGVAAATAWHAMMWAKANQYRFYDLRGISARAARLVLGSEPGTAAHLTGAEAFKTRFGGEAFQYPEQVELISSPFLRLAYDMSRRTAAGGRVIALVKRTLRGGRTRSRHHACP